MIFKIKFYFKDFFSKCDQIRRLLRIWSQILEKSLMENFIFCAVRHEIERLMIHPKFLREIYPFLFLNVVQKSFHCECTPALREKCPILCISPYSVQMRGNTDQK